MANSFVRYTGNGATTAYAIPFSYRSVDDLSATVNGVVVTAYTLDGAGTTLTFDTAPAASSAIEIRRTTSQATKLVDYVSGSVLTENDLDTDSDQAFFMAQEAIDKAGDVISLDGADFQWDVQNKRLKNVAAPVADTDAVNKAFITTNLPNINTVAGIAADVTTVAGISGNVTTVAANDADITTVATNIASVNTVATDIAKVIAVADDLAEAVSEVETVANDLNEATSEIEVVANNITNVDTVGTNIANVNTVAGISGNVTTVAGISSDVTGVAGISTAVTNVNSNSTNINAVNANSANINTVAGINADVTTVSGISADVTSVAGISGAVTAVNSNSTNINAVNANSTNINTVAGNNTNINTVAAADANITTVAGISADVTAVAGDATDIGTVATDLAGSNNVGTVAGSIANVNLVGGSIASVNTVATNIADVNSFANTYRIAASAPVTSLDVGDLYFDTTANELKVYKASGWSAAGSTVNGTSARFTYNITGTPSSVSGSDANGNTLAYDAGFADVYVNGVRMSSSDITITSGTSVVFASALADGDVVDIVAYGTFNVAAIDASNITSGILNIARIADGSITNAKLATPFVLTNPTISSIAPDTITNDATNVVITGTNFVITPNVEIIASTGAITYPNSITRDSATQLTINVTLPTDGTYFIRVENPDGLAVRSSTALLTVSDAPTWSTASGSLGSVASGSAVSLSVAGTSDSTVAYSETTAVLTSNTDTPNSTMNLSLNSATGAITGTAPEPTAEKVYNFTLRLTDAESQTTDRVFSITVTTGINNGGQFN
jgi:hypothetical protein